MKLNDCHHNNKGTTLLHWNKVIASPYHESEMWHPFCETNSVNQSVVDSDQEPGVPQVPSADLLVSLCYQGNAKKLHVKVFKARNLPQLDKFGLSGNYNLS